MAIRNGDLDKTLTVEQALDLVDALAEAALDLVDADLEHWTDDEGVHVLPFQKSLSRWMSDTLRQKAEVELKELNIV